MRAAKRSCLHGAAVKANSYERVGGQVVDVPRMIILRVTSASMGIRAVLVSSLSLEQHATCIPSNDGSFFRGTIHTDWRGCHELQERIT